ncbi:MAG TPA: DNA polymerase III subunit delta [Vicinamibacteria bacterium]|nr:DNA polymerase III subunit delta [Vicinamibacteria bacterium]
MARPTRPGPIQAIVGEDTYLAEEALERVLAAAIGDDRQDALQVFHGDEAKWEDVLAAARTGSLFAPRRAVVVRRAELLKGDEEAVAGYAAEPTPDATLVLVAAKPDRRRNPWKKILPKVTVHDAAPKRGRALRAHVEQELRARGLRFAPEAFEELVSEVGQDLRRLMGEVDKLEAFSGGRREISADDVSAVLGRGLGRPLYLLSDAFASRDAPRSLELVERLLGDGEEALRLLSTLHRSLRQVRAARAMREARAPRDEIAARLLPPNMHFKLDGLLEASRRWSEPDLRRGLLALGEVDRRVKTGADAATALVAAVAGSCGRGAAAPRRATWPRRGR